MMQTVNKAMLSDKTSHQTHRAHDVRSATMLGKSAWGVLVI